MLSHIIGKLDLPRPLYMALILLFNDWSSRGMPDSQVIGVGDANTNLATILASHTKVLYQIENEISEVRGQKRNCHTNQEICLE